MGQVESSLYLRLKECTSTPSVQLCSVSLTKCASWSNASARQSAVTDCSLQLLCRCYSVAKSCLTLCHPMNCSTPGSPVLHYLLEYAQIMSIKSVMPSNHLIHPPSPFAFNLSQHQGLFQGVSSLHQMAKVLELQLQHQSFQCYSGLTSFRIDWFDLLVVQLLNLILI